MRVRLATCTMLVLTLSAARSLAQQPAEALRNDSVRVVEQSVSAGDSLKLPPDHASVIVYKDAGSIEVSSPGRSQKSSGRGDTVFVPPASTLKNTGSSPLHFVLVEFLTKGNDALTWGTTGLAPNYKLLFENEFARVYDIKIPAGGTEPQHTHRQRVIVCLSGAELEHILPDGKKEPSSVKTDEIAWRPAATHIGHNIGKTDLWVIAIEPK